MKGREMDLMKRITIILKKFELTKYSKNQTSLETELKALIKKLVPKHLQGIPDKITSITTDTKEVEAIMKLHTTEEIIVDKTEIIIEEKREEVTTEKTIVDKIQISIIVAITTTITITTIDDETTVNSGNYD